MYTCLLRPVRLLKTGKITLRSTLRLFSSSLRSRFAAAILISVAVSSCSNAQDESLPASATLPAVAVANTMKQGAVLKAADLKIRRISVQKYPSDTVREIDDAVSVPLKNAVEGGHLLNLFDLYDEPSAAAKYPVKAIHRWGPCQSPNQNVALNVVFNAALIALSNSDAGRKRISAMITCVDGKDNYSIQFHDKPADKINRFQQYELGNKFTNDYFESWASLLNKAFAEHYESLPEQQKSSGNPQILIALSIIGKDGEKVQLEEAKTVPPKSFTQLLPDSLASQRPIIVALKHTNEDENKPFVTEPTAMAIIAYDESTQKVTLANSTVLALPEGLPATQIDPFTVSIDAEQLRKCTRYIAVLQSSI